MAPDYKIDYLIAYTWKGQSRNVPLVKKEEALLGINGREFYIEILSILFV